MRYLRYYYSIYIKYFKNYNQKDLEINYGKSIILIEPSI